MKKNYKTKNNTSRLVPLLFFLLVVFCSACSKKSQEIEQIIKTKTDIYSYEVTCNACEIQFLDKNNNTKKVINNNGKWSYSFDGADAAELKINVITTSSAYQNINAYILKNNEVIYGELGYNNFELLYNVKSGQRSMAYGSYSPGPGVPGSNGGNTKPTSSLCGAKNKTGGYCQRVVSGGGRCWQHR